MFTLQGTGYTGITEVPVKSKVFLLKPKFPLNVGWSFPCYSLHAYCNNVETTTKLVILKCLKIK